MLRALHVSNYILIDSLDISFPGGLVIITGQTGAGKSILVGALGLLLGGKADASLIGPRGDNCVLEAEFDVRDDEAVRAAIEAEDLDWNGGIITIRRTFSRSGRSRSFLCDEPVALPTLAALAPRLIDIHSQHRNLLLSDRDFQMEALDLFAGAVSSRKAVGGLWKELCGLRGALEEASETLRRLSGEKDYNEARYERLESACLRDGELEELEEELRKLSNVEQLKEAFGGVEAMASPEEGLSPAAALKEASRLLSRISGLVTDAGPLAERLNSARLEIEDIFEEAASLSEGVNASPERLAAVEARLSLLYDLLKRYSCNDVASLIRERDALAEALYDTGAIEERIALLQKEIASKEAEYSAAALKLSELRSAAAPHFSAAVAESLGFLLLEKAVFKVSVDEAPAGPSGKDRITFLFSSTGKEPEDLRKCASGGEMSRIMLSLKAMMARYESLPSIVFDEIDSGVSGSAADRMGEMICTLGASMQVFAITHLPQVAAKGTAHFLVEKTVGAPAADAAPASASTATSAATGAAP
ncbi:MAG: AAA family ATPase, partial [Bacteroidales bacterium]|nr:AAA family ATPase [Bacteroidales bacterium]